MKMESDAKQVTRNIKACRQRTGQTQKMIAKIMGITKQTYISIENNPFKYSIDKLINVANAIGCDINDFFLQ